MDSTTTPSLVSQQYQRMLKISFMIMLSVNLLVYAFATWIGSGEMGAVDMTLLLFGYIAMDLLRPSALNIYWLLTCVSAFVDTLTTALVTFYNSSFESRNGEGSTMLGFQLFLLWAFWLVEQCAKIASVWYAKKLADHLVQVPGQSLTP